MLLATSLRPIVDHFGEQAMGRLIYQRYFVKVDHTSSLAKMLARVLPQFLQLPDPGAGQFSKQHHPVFGGTVDKSDL